MKAWTKLKASTIKKCFVKCGFSEDLFEEVTSDDDDDDDDDDESFTICSVLSIELLLNIEAKWKYTKVGPSSQYIY